MGAPSASPAPSARASSPSQPFTLPTASRKRTRSPAPIASSDLLPGHAPAKAAGAEGSGEVQRTGAEQAGEEDEIVVASPNKSASTAPPPEGPTKRTTRSASISKSRPSPFRARKGPTRTRRPSYAESDSSLTSLDNSSASDDDDGDENRDDEAFSPASSPVSHKKKRPGAPKSSGGGAAAGKKKPSTATKASQKKPVFLATAMSKAELIRGAFSSEAPLVPEPGRILKYLPEPVEEEDEDERPGWKGASSASASTAKKTKTRRASQSSATGAWGGRKGSKSFPASQRRASVANSTLAPDVPQRLQTRFTPPASMPLTLAVFRRRESILQEARMEATREASLQAQSEQAIQHALESLPQGDQQTTLCLTMNRYTAFCNHSSVDVPVFPITNPKLALFFSRVPCTTLSSHILATFPRLPSDQYPLPQAGMLDPALAPQEGDSVTRELLRSWVDAMAYAQIATRGTWEGVFARQGRGKGKKEELVGGHSSLRSVNEDDAVMEILKAVESVQSVQDAAVEAEKSRLKSGTRGEGAAVSKGKGREDGLGDPLMEEQLEESGPDKKRTKWMRGGKSVLGPSPGQRASSSSSNASGQRRSSAVHTSQAFPTTFDYTATPRPLEPEASVSPSTSRHPEYQQRYTEQPFYADTYRQLDPYAAQSPVDAISQIDNSAGHDGVFSYSHPSPESFQPHQRRPSHSHSPVDLRNSYALYDPARRTSLVEQPSTSTYSAFPSPAEQSSSTTTHGDWAAYGGGIPSGTVETSSHLSPVLENSTSSTNERGTFVEEQAHPLPQPIELGGQGYEGTAVAVETAGEVDTTGEGNGALNLASTVESGSMAALTATILPNDSQSGMTTAMLAQQELAGLHEAIAATESAFAYAAESSQPAPPPSHLPAQHSQQYSHTYSTPAQREDPYPRPLPSSSVETRYPSSSHTPRIAESSTFPPILNARSGYYESYEEQPAYGEDRYRPSPSTSYPASQVREHHYPPPFARYGHSQPSNYDWSQPISSRQNYPTPAAAPHPSSSYSRQPYVESYQPSPYAQYSYGSPSTSRYPPPSSMQHDRHYSHPADYGYEEGNYPPPSQYDARYDPHYDSCYRSRKPAQSYESYERSYGDVDAGGGTASYEYTSRPPARLQTSASSAALSSVYGARPYSYPTPETPSTAQFGGERIAATANGVDGGPAGGYGYSTASTMDEEARYSHGGGEGARVGIGLGISAM